MPGSEGCHEAARPRGEGPAPRRWRHALLRPARPPLARVADRGRRAGRPALRGHRRPPHVELGFRDRNRGPARAGPAGPLAGQAFPLPAAAPAAGPLGRRHPGAARQRRGGGGAGGRLLAGGRSLLPGPGAGGYAQARGPLADRLLPHRTRGRGPDLAGLARLPEPRVSPAPAFLADGGLRGRRALPAAPLHPGHGAPSRELWGRARIAPDMSTPASAPPDAPDLARRFGLLQATALNMSNMIGIGPFITIPLLMSALGGPQAMVGWLVAVLIVIPDGMVWSELGASLPGSGGSYVYLREGYGRETWGRLAAFLFIWQFILSGPLEIASGYIGFSRYVGYLWPGLGQWDFAMIAAVVGVLNVALLYRAIGPIGKLTVTLWVGTLLTTGAVIATGALHFDPAKAFDFPPGAFQFSLGFLLGLGAASRIGIYDYLGYYDVCYIGEEVRDPGRVIPRSILISLVAVALIYFAINLSLIGVVPWREFVPAKDPPDAVASLFMEKLYGSKVASGFTVMVLWTAVGSVFALMLGYSRIPYAAAQNGDFFRVFGRLHPKKDFPHLSLLTIGLVSIIC